MKKLGFSFLLVLFSALPAFAEEVKVSVNGMVCAFCAQGITKKFSAQPAVEKVDVKLENHLVTLKIKDNQKISDEEIGKILKDAGYSVSKIERI